MMAVVPGPPQGARKAAPEAVSDALVSISSYPSWVRVDRFLNPIDEALRGAARRITALEARANRLALVGFGLGVTADPELADR
jgi:hypothetical protein